MRVSVCGLHAELWISCCVLYFLLREQSDLYQTPGGLSVNETLLSEEVRMELSSS